MPSRLAGILFCILLANVLNYALGSWLDRQVPNLAPPVATVDGSAVVTTKNAPTLPSR